MDADMKIASLLCVEDQSETLLEELSRYVLKTGVEAMQFFYAFFESVRSSFPCRFQHCLNASIFSSALACGFVSRAKRMQWLLRESLTSDLHSRQSFFS